MTAESAPEPVRRRTRVVVRVNRRRCLSIVIVGIPLSVALILLDPASGDRAVDDLWRAAGILIGAFAFQFLDRLFRHWYFTFDAESRKLTARGRWGSERTYPRHGFDRIEYSTYDAGIYEVAANGKRRRLPVRRWFADRRDWKTFADTVLDGDAPNAEGD